MTAKEIVSYVGGIAMFVLVASLLRGRLPEEYALGLGWLAMFLVGFPFTRYLSANKLTFTRWAVFSTLSAFAGNRNLVRVEECRLRHLTSERAQARGPRVTNAALPSELFQHDIYQSLRDDDNLHYLVALNQRTDLLVVKRSRAQFVFGNLR